MNKLKVAVIGAGSISGVHLQAYANHPEVDLQAVCDINRERAQEAALKYGIPDVYTDYRELLADDSIEAVSICTWNNTHAPISIAALKAGKHVLVEKPLSKTISEAEEIAEAVSASNGKVLQVGFVRRYSQNTEVLKKFIDAGDLGDIYYAKATCLRRLGNPGGWFAEKESSGGGPLIDLGVHIIDVCWYLMGKPKVKSVSGNTYSCLGNRSNIHNLSFYKAADYDAQRNDVEDLANAIIRFENGASLMVDVSFTLHAKQDEMSVKLYGDKGGAELEPGLQIISEKFDTILNATPQIDYPTFDFISGFQNEINHFIDSCTGRSNTISPVEDGLEMMKILSAIYESARLQQEVHFN